MGNNITFDLTYLPVVLDFKKILKEINVILASDYKHERTLFDVTMIGLKIIKVRRST